MFLYVFPSAKKWSVYHFNGRFILTARDKRKTWLSTWWQNPCWQSQRSDVSCSWPPGLHTSQEGICPTLCGSSPSLQYVWRRVVPKELDFGLIWPQHFHPVLLWIIGKLQTGLYMCFLEQGDLGRCMISVFHGVVLPIVFLVTMVPAALRSLTRSSRLDLGWPSPFSWSLTPWNTRWDLAWSPSPREIDSYFVSFICE